MSYVEGGATPRSVWEQDRTVIENFGNTDPLPGTPEVGVVFLAPRSGRVLIAIGGQIRDNSGVQRVFLRPEVYRGTSAAFANLRIEDGAFKEFASSPPETQYMAGSRLFILEGLVPLQEHYARVTHYTVNPGGAASNVADIAAREIVVLPMP